MGARRGRHLQPAAALSTALGFVGTPAPSCVASAPRFRTRGDGWEPGRSTVPQLLTPQSHWRLRSQFPFDYNIIHSTSAQALRNAIRAPGTIVIGTALPSQAGRQRVCCAARGPRCGAGPGPPREQKSRTSCWPSTRPWVGLPRNALSSSTCRTLRRRARRVGVPPTRSCQLLHCSVLALALSRCAAASPLRALDALAAGLQASASVRLERAGWGGVCLDLGANLRHYSRRACQVSVPRRARGVASVESLAVQRATAAAEQKPLGEAGHSRPPLRRR